MKKIAAGIITLMLLISCCIIAAFPTSAVDINYDDFDIYDGVIVEYLGEGGEVVIPSYDADGNPITTIGSRAFWAQADVTAVYICEGITEIQSEAFEGCTQLSEVSLPYSLESLGDYSPFRRTSVASIVIPGKVKVIPDTLITTVGVEEGGLGVHFTDLVLTPGVEEIRAGSLYFAGTEIVFPSSVYLISGVALTFNRNTLSLYICNPDCEIGTLKEEKEAYKPNSNENTKYKDNAPIALIWEADSPVKIYASKSATGIKETIESWKAKYGGNYVFLGQDDSVMEEKNTWCKENGITKPTKWVMDKDGKLEDTDSSAAQGGSDNKANSNNNNAAASSNGNNNTLMYVIIGMGALLIIVIIAAVVIVVVMNNKKKAAAKRRAAKRKAKAEAEKTAEAKVPDGTDFEEKTESDANAATDTAEENKNDGNSEEQK